MLRDLCGLVFSTLKESKQLLSPCLVLKVSKILSYDFYKGPKFSNFSLDSASKVQKAKKNDWIGWINNQLTDQFEQKLKKFLPQIQCFHLMICGSQSDLSCHQLFLLETRNNLQNIQNMMYTETMMHESDAFDAKISQFQ